MAIIQFNCSATLYLPFYSLFLGIYNYSYLELSFFTHLLDTQIPHKYMQFFFINLQSILYIFFIIPDIIMLFLNKRRINNNDYIPIITSKKRILLNEGKYMQPTIKVFLLIFLTGLLSSNINLLTFQYFQLQFPANIYFCMGNIFFSWLFIYFWKKVKLYRHHLFALGIMIITGIINILIVESVLSNYFKLIDFQWYLILIAIMMILCISSREVIEKYLIEIAYVKHFRLLVYEGLISLVINVIIYFLLPLIDCNRIKINLLDFCRENAKESLEDLLLVFTQWKNIVNIILYIVGFFMMNYCRLLMNKYYESSLRYTGDSFSFLVMIIIERIIVNIANVDWWDMAYTIQTILSFIACMIYQENIRIYLCKMASNTKYEIAKRGDEDVNDIEKIMIVVIKEDECLIPQNMNIIGV